MTRKARINLGLLYMLGVMLVIEDILEQTSNSLKHHYDNQSTETLKFVNDLVGPIIDIVNACGILYLFKIMSQKLIDT